MATGVYQVIVRRTIEEKFEVPARSRDDAKIKVAMEHGAKLGVIGVDWSFAIVANIEKKEKK